MVSTECLRSSLSPRTLQRAGEKTKVWNSKRGASRREVALAFHQTGNFQKGMLAILTRGEGYLICCFSFRPKGSTNSKKEIMAHCFHLKGTVKVLISTSDQESIITCFLQNYISVSTYLFCWQTTLQGYLTYPALSNHHSLGTPKSTEGCVGGQICFTDNTDTSDIWDVVGIVHVKHSSVHNLGESI